jgi:hypothetical protein
MGAVPARVCPLGRLEGEARGAAPEEAFEVCVIANYFQFREHTDASPSYTIPELSILFLQRGE